MLSRFSIILLLLVSVCSNSVLYTDPPNSTPIPILRDPIQVLGSGTINTPLWALPLFWSNDKLVINGSLGVWLWDLSNEPHLLNRWQSIRAITPDGHTVLAENKDGTLLVGDLLSEEIRFEIPNEPERLRIEKQQFSPDSAHLGIVFNELAEEEVFLPDGTSYHPLSNNHILQLWDVAAGEMSAEYDIPPNDGYLLGIGFRPSGQLFRASPIWSKPDRIGLRDAATGDSLIELHNLGFTSSDPMLSEDGTHILITRGNEYLIGYAHVFPGIADMGFPFMVWDTTSGELLQTIAPHIDISSENVAVDLSNNGHYLAASFHDIYHFTEPHASGNDQILVWDLETGEQLLEIDSGISNFETFDSTPVTFNSDGTRLAAVLEQQTIAVWDTHSGEQVAICDQFMSAPLSLGISADNSQVIYAGQSGDITSWDLDTGVSRRLENPYGYADQVVFVSPNSLLVAVRESLAGGWAQQVVQYDLNTSEADLVPMAQDSLGRTTLSPDGSLLYVSDEYGTYGYDLVAGRRLDFIPIPGKVYAITFNLSSTLIAGGSCSGSISLWSSRTHEQMVWTEGHTDTVSAMAFNAENTRLYSLSVTGLYQPPRPHEEAQGGDHTLRVWSVPDLTPVAVVDLRAYHLSGNGVFSPDGSLLAVDGLYESNQTVIYIIDTDNGNIRAIIPQVGNCIKAFTTDSRRLIIGNPNGTLSVWDLPE